MKLRQALLDSGEVTPLATGGAYAVATIALNVFVAIMADNILVVLLGFFSWIAMSVLFFVVVTWFRDDDWLASGFLLGISAILSIVIANAVSGAIGERSLAPLIAAAPSMFFAVITRGIILVPLAGGAVALARRLTRGRTPAPSRHRPTVRPTRRGGDPSRGAASGS